MNTRRRRLEHRKNNAYDSVLLIESGKVVGAWMTDRRDKVWADWLAPGNLDDWDATAVPSTDPKNYGDLEEQKS